MLFKCGSGSGFSDTRLLSVIVFVDILLSLRCQLQKEEVFPVVWVRQLIDAEFVHTVVVLLRR